MIKIYTDGACFNNGKPDAVGGWGYVIIEDGEILTSHGGAEAGSTNQRMELTAVIEALKTFDLYYRKPFVDYEVNSDSAYLINCVNQNWYRNWEINGWKNSKSEPVANKDLWIQLIPYFKDCNATFKKVQGHSGDQYNELVDSLAVKYRTILQNSLSSRT